MAPLQDEPVTDPSIGRMKAFAATSESYICGIANEDGSEASTIGLADLPRESTEALRRDLREEKRGFLILEQVSLVSSTGVRRDIACAVPLTSGGMRVLFAAVKRTRDAMAPGSKLVASTPTSVRNETVEKSSRKIVTRSKAAELLLSRLPRETADRESVAANRSTSSAFPFGSRSLVITRKSLRIEGANSKSPILVSPSSGLLSASNQTELLTPVLITATQGVFLFDFSAFISGMRQGVFGVLTFMAEDPPTAEECALREALENAENQAEEIAFALFALNDDMKAWDDREVAVLANAKCECVNPATTLCIDFWIEAEQLIGLGPIIGYGDARNSDPNASREKSRVQINIGKTAAHADPLVNSTFISMNGGQDTLELVPTSVAGDFFEKQQVNDTTVYLNWNFKNAACKLASLPAGWGAGSAPELLCPGITGHGTFVFGSNGEPISYLIARDAFPAVGVHKKVVQNGVCGFLQLQEDRTKKSGRPASRMDLFPFGRTDIVKGGNDPCNPQ